jgi:hypothetical protein
MQQGNMEHEDTPSQDKAEQPMSSEEPRQHTGQPSPDTTQATDQQQTQKPTRTTTARWQAIMKGELPEEGVQGKPWAIRTGSAQITARCACGKLTRAPNPRCDEATVLCQFCKDRIKYDEAKKRTRDRDSRLSDNSAAVPGAKGRIPDTPATTSTATSTSIQSRPSTSGSVYSQPPDAGQASHENALTSGRSDDATRQAWVNADGMATAISGQIEEEEEEEEELSLLDDGLASWRGSNCSAGMGDWVQAPYHLAAGFSMEEDLIDLVAVNAGSTVAGETCPHAHATGSRRSDEENSSTPSSSSSSSSASAKAKGKELNALMTTRKSVASRAPSTQSSSNTIALTDVDEEGLKRKVS